MSERRRTRPSLLTWMVIIAAMAVYAVIGQGVAVADPPEEDPTACTIGPSDPVSGTWRGAGSGTPQVRANRVLIKATDTGWFEVTCSGTDSSHFTVDLEYWFEYHDGSGFQQVGPTFSCSAGSVGGEGVEVAVATDGAGACPFARVIFPEDHPSLGFPHRLHVLVTMADGVHIEGVSLPWTHLKVG